MPPQSLERAEQPNDRSLYPTAENQPDKILVFIPAYNCAPQIPRVLAKLAQVPHGTFAQVLVVDNQSKDGTVAAATDAASKLTNLDVLVVRNSDNYGLGGSHKSAFAHAAANSFTHVIVLHGDDQGRIEDVLPVLALGLHRRFHSCLGSRFARRSTLHGYALTRRLGNFVFNALFTLVSGRWITDLGSGLNIFSRRVFTDPTVLRYSDDLRFNCYLLLGLVDRRYTFRYFPIHWSEEDQISNVKIVSQSLNTLKILWQYLTNRQAFRTADHRATPRPAYTFNVVHHQPALPAASQPALQESTQ